MTKKILVIFIFVMAAFSINAKATSETISVDCTAVVFRQDYNSLYSVEKSITKEIKLRKKMFNRDISKVKISEDIIIDTEYSIHFNLFGELNSRNHSSIFTVEAELRRHRGGNGKIVLGETKSEFKRLNQLKSIPNLELDLVNMKDLGYILSLENLPKSTNDNFLEAVNNGILTEGVVKNAFLKCSAL